jgi:hypothetical protein
MARGARRRPTNNPTLRSEWVLATLTTPIAWFHQRLHRRAVFLNLKPSELESDHRLRPAPFLARHDQVVVGELDSGR